ncbi:MAG: ribonuclease III [Bacteroidetes bacterium]|nr:ribonuclease III [Bacteroidota bacterium]
MKPGILNRLTGFLFSRNSNSAKNGFSKLAGYPVRNADLFIQALSHRSYFDDPADQLSKSNERLEFLGDAILDSVVAEHLFRTFPDKDEGFLSKKRDQIVNGRILAEFSKDLGLLDLMNISFQAKKRAACDSPKLLADALEAFIGAIFLDHSFEMARKFINSRILSSVDLKSLADQDNNYKSILLEMVQSDGISDLRYLCISEEGPAHRKEYTMQVKIDEVLYGIGRGKSKKDAEQIAAYETLRMKNQL